MTTRWSSPLTEARPPAPRRRIDWLNILVWVIAPLAFWLGVAFGAIYLIGVL